MLPGAISPRASTAVHVPFALPSADHLASPCCQALNRPSGLWGGWGGHLVPTFGVQLSMAHMLLSGEGRAAYARYAALLAASVAAHPAAIGLELMNEPPFLPFAPPFLETAMYDLYRQCYEAVRAVSAELAVGLGDSGEMAHYADDARLPPATRAWLRNATHLLYTFHWYRSPVWPSYPDSLANARALSAAWGATPVLTEVSKDAALLELAEAAGVAWAFYPYHPYCSVPEAASLEPASGCEAGQDCAFGACIT